MELIHRIEYRLLTLSDLKPELLKNFYRDQEVNKVWSTVDGKKMLIDNPFKEEWSKEYKDELVTIHFAECIRSGGCVIAAFYKGEVIAFAMLLNSLFGSGKQYIQLFQFNVSFGYLSLGIGKHMFAICIEEAKKRGAKKLYISSHSSDDTQAFYKSVGCVRAEEKNDVLSESKPFDIQLEYIL